MVRATSEPQPPKHFGLKCTLGFLFALPFVATGILLCITIIGIPLGVLIAFLGCLPLSITVRNYTFYHSYFKAVRRLQKAIGDPDAET